MRIKVIIRESPTGGYRAEVPLLPGFVSEAPTTQELLIKVQKATAERLGNGESVEFGVIEFPGDFSQKDLDDAWAAHQRGECQELSEAFAEIAGLSVEDWLKKVEAHQRR
ncbi:MAG: hypothetical protein K2R98_19790 [Gemmataceae bacterium]|nr:hypothetical protein [Gemmataceae bacterium]